MPRPQDGEELEEPLQEYEVECEPEPNVYVFGGILQKDWDRWYGNGGDCQTEAASSTDGLAQSHDLQKDWDMWYENGGDCQTDATSSTDGLARSTVHDLQKDWDMWYENGGDCQTDAAASTDGPCAINRP